MTDEERQRTMDFILEQQAQFTANFQKSEEARKADDERFRKIDGSFQKADERFRQAERRLDRLERIVKLAVRAGLRERHARREQNERIAALVDAQIHTEAIARQNAESISRLAEIVGRMATKNGNRKEQ